MITIISLFALTSCSLFSNRHDKRKLQTKIYEKITAKAKDLSHCASKTKLFEHQNSVRVKVSLTFSLNSSGQIERFKLKDDYPVEFTDCLFKKIDAIDFSNLIDDNMIVNVGQAFIFSK